ncbi:MAG: hypothetical protein JJT90_14145 [Ectothiorhodospiraceae bacterium]|nr:hypothetical protein [Ectothiorhodospiraceae bacterium]
MNPTDRSQYSAAPSALGYIYQVRYALLESLQRLRKGQDFLVAIETLDDVVFEQDGQAPELFQTKHHVNSAADLTDGSTDLWKTLRIWCEGIQAGSVPTGTLYFLVTTAEAADGHAAHYLKPGENRNPDTAMERLNSTANSSTNQTNAPAYEAYRGLKEKQRKELLQNAFVVDGAPHIVDMDSELKEVSYGFAQSKFLDSFLQRLEGWWYRRAIRHLTNDDENPILSEELDSETASLREQFKEESLPIDEEIMRASVDASGYQDRLFVHQLRIIEVGNNRIFHAIRNLYRAYEQRSRWMREDLLYVGELDKYEDRLVEEWDILFQQMRDDLGEQASEDAKKAAAQTLYKWVETESHRGIRPGVTEPSIPRGTYQLLSDAQRVGWHIDFVERLRRLLDDQEATA